MIVLKEKMYSIVQGCQINHIIGNRIDENKKKFFRELDTPSLEKISNCAETCCRYCGTDGCYYCVIINYVHEEYRHRRGTNSMCLILHKGKNYCLCFDCHKDNEIHYFL